MKTFRSKIGPEVAIPLTVIFAGIGGTAIYRGDWIGLVVILPVILFILHLFSNTYYQVNGAEVTIKSGFLISKTLQIQSIQKIVETKNPISSPALSLDRIELRYNRFDAVLISPKDKAGFINALLQVNPDIEIKLKKEADYAQLNYGNTGLPKE